MKKVGHVQVDEREAQDVRLDSTHHHHHHHHHHHQKKKKKKKKKGMLKSVRASIPAAAVLPLKLTGKERGIGQFHSPSVSLKTTQFVGCLQLQKRGRSMSEDATANSTEGGDGLAEEVVVQYVVLRRDLIDKWPLGSVVTQGCHASVAAIWEHKNDPSTLRYCSPPSLDSMHKVTLEVKGETQILNLSEKLNSAGILHKLWIEQPENFPTCLATKPYPKSVVSPFFKKLKLCK